MEQLPSKRNNKASGSNEAAGLCIRCCALKSTSSWTVAANKELIEHGPRNAIGLGDLRHFAVDALIEPSQRDNVDTSLRS